MSHRDGRIDLQIEIPLPPPETRKALFKSSLKNVHHIDQNIDLDYLVNQTEGFPISSIKGVVKRAVSMAAEARDRVSMKHLESARIEIEKKLVNNPKFQF